METEKITEPDDEISLIDLFAVLLHYKWLIILLPFVAAVAVVVFAVISLKLPPEKSPLPNEYTPQAHMLIKQSSSGSSSLSSALSSSGLGSLASLAGVNVGGGSTNSSLAVYLAGSNPLLDAVTDKFDIISRYKIQDHVRASSRKMLQKTLRASIDDESSVFTISFTDTDPAFACDVVNFVVDWLSERFDTLGLDNNKIQKENLEKNIQSSYNEILRLEREARSLGASVSGGSAAWDIPSITTGSARLQMELEAQKQVYTQLKTQYELLKVTMQSEQPVFQILERPEIPDQKSGPSRGKLCIIVVFAAFFMAVFLAFACNAFKNIRNDPEAWGKLTQKPEK
ncbi:MAG: lipopolysaccharide biosynthesis protein [Treponema sp.]|nr:lipopolysaccharide biosynthesis protein [Treponema sp.]